MEKVESRLRSFLRDHQRYARMLSLTKASGARGWIDPVALRIVDASPMSLDDFLARLEDEDAIELRFSVGGGEAVWATLTWIDGVLVCDFEYDSGRLRFAHGEVMLPAGTLPDTVLATVPGRRLGDLIDCELLPQDGIVFAIGDDKHGTRLDVSVERLLLDAASGEPRAPARAWPPRS